MHQKVLLRIKAGWEPLCGGRAAGALLEGHGWGGTAGGSTAGAAAGAHRATLPRERGADAGAAAVLVRDRNCKCQLLR